MSLVHTRVMAAFLSEHFDIYLTEEHLCRWMTKNLNYNGEWLDNVAYYRLRARIDNLLEQCYPAFTDEDFYQAEQMEEKARDQDLEVWLDPEERGLKVVT
jgi:hypothetical protein